MQQRNFVVINGNYAGQWRSLNEATRSINLIVPFGIALIAAVFGILLHGIILWLVAATALSFIVLCEPRLGLYMLGAAIAADSVPFDPVTRPLGILFLNLHRLLFTPVELAILWTLVCMCIRGVSEQRLQLPNRTSLMASCGLTFFILAGIANGLIGGGNLTVAIWETRAILVVPAVMLLTSGLILERRHVLELGFVMLGALGLMTIEVAYRYITYIQPAATSDILESAFNHDGAMLIAVVSVTAGAGLLWGPQKKIKLASLAIFALSALVVMVSRRRAAVVGMETGYATLGALLLITNWRKFAVLGPVVLLVGCIYMAAFWNNQSSLGQPARSFRSVFLSDTASDRDKSSDDYRRIERLNVWWDIQSNPIRGSGFGTAYAKPIPMVNLSSFWPFWDDIPHNNVLWLWLKGGVFTFMAFWFFLGTIVSQGVTTARRLRSPFLTAVIASSIAYFVMVVMFAYVDLGLTSSRLMILFGITTGLLSVLDVIWPKANEAVIEQGQV